MTTITLHVPEISCGHCKETIEAAVGGIDGVQRAEVDVAAKTVTVDGGERPAIVRAIEDAGFDVAS